MNWVTIPLSFVLGAVAFWAIQNFLHFNIWVSVALAVAATLFAWLEKGVASPTKPLIYEKKRLKFASF